MRHVALVSCSKAKLSRPAPAWALYSSPLFELSREWAHRVSGGCWFVLSAKHGLVHPDTVLEPYELELSNLPLKERQAWGAKVVDDLVGTLGEPARPTLVHILAGQGYSAALRTARAPWSWQWREPLQGMQIGERLRYLKLHLEGGQGRASP